MAENVAPEAVTPLASNGNDADTTHLVLVPGASAATGSNTTRAGRYQNCHNIQQSSTSKDFEGVTHKIGSENVTKKVNYDIFYE